MEYLDAIPLNRYSIYKTETIWVTIHTIATACLHALDYYHSQGYLHCVTVWNEHHLVGYYSEQYLLHERSFRETG